MDETHDRKLSRLVEDLRQSEHDMHRHDRSTPAYHEHAQEVEDLSREVYKTALDAELDAQEHAELGARERADDAPV